MWGDEAMDLEGSSKPVNRHAPCCGDVSKIGEVSKHPKLEGECLLSLLKV